MSYRTIVTIAAASIVCVACVATDAMAYRGGYRAGGARVGGYGGVYRGGAYRGAYVRRGVAAGAIGAAAVGAAVAAPYYNGGYYNSAACGYYPRSALQLSCIATRTSSVGWAKAPTGPRKARPDDKLRAVPTKAFREALMSRYRRSKAERFLHACARRPWQQHAMKMPSGLPFRATSLLIFLGATFNHSAETSNRCRI